MQWFSCKGHIRLYGSQELSWQQKWGGPKWRSSSYDHHCNRDKVSLHFLPEPCIDSSCTPNYCTLLVGLVDPVSLHTAYKLTQQWLLKYCLAVFPLQVFHLQGRKREGQWSRYGQWHSWYIWWRDDRDFGGASWLVVLLCWPSQNGHKQYIDLGSDWSTRKLQHCDGIVCHSPLSSWILSRCCSTCGKWKGGEYLGCCHGTTLQKYWLCCLNSADS